MCEPRTLSGKKKNKSAVTHQKKTTFFFLFLFFYFSLFLTHLLFVFSVKPWMALISSFSTLFTRRCCWISDFPWKTGETMSMLKKVPQPALTSTTFIDCTGRSASLDCNFASISAAVKDTRRRGTARNMLAKRNHGVRICLRKGLWQRKKKKDRKQVAVWFACVPLSIRQFIAK